MIKYYIVFCLFVLCIEFCFTDVIEDPSVKTDVLSEKQMEEYSQNDVVNFIEMFEEVALRARKSLEEDLLPLEDSLLLYDEMTAIAQDIIDLNVNPNNVYKFLYAKGLDRVVAPNLKISHVPLRRQLLILTKQLFDIAPSTVKNLIPVAILDGLLEIFESDGNLPVKAYALDVLNLWLPGSPRMQARVMKLKGLEPFYHQIAKLDVAVVQTLLELFNEILDEHIRARVEGSLKKNGNLEDLALYQRIGLLERMSTSQVCNGLLNVFETSLPVITASGRIMPSMFELITKIEPFCLKRYRGKSKPNKVFNELLQILEDPKREVEFGERGVNVTQIRSVLEKYVRELNQNIVKDEL
ncbi:unnamed protein product, partial [Iphiclides podalirius]